MKSLQSVYQQEHGQNLQVECHLDVIAWLKSLEDYPNGHETAGA